MKTITRRVPLAVLGAGLIVALTILGLWLSGHYYQAARAQGPVIVGYDMNTAGNSCLGDGVTDCTLGAINPCIEVAAGATFHIDVFLEGLPNVDPDESILGFGYTIEWGPSDFLDINSQTHTSTTVNLAAQELPFVPIDLSDTVPDADSPHNVNFADFGAAEYNPPYTHGTLGRYNVTVPAATAAGLYGLTLTGVTLGRDVPPGGDLCVDYVCQIWDASALPQAYGQIAVTPEACPGPRADVAITDQAFVTPPTDIIVGVDADVTLRKTLHNNGPAGPVSVDVNTGVTPPANCTALLHSQTPPNPVSLELDAGADITVDEVWTINCGVEGPGVIFPFTNEITIADPPNATDPDETNNSASTDLPVNVAQFLGSVDCNAQWNSVDALFVLQYALRLKAESNQCPLVGNTMYLPAADVDDDGNVDVIDALFILQCAAGLTGNVLCPGT